MIGKPPDIRFVGPCSRSLSGQLNTISVSRIREDRLVVFSHVEADELIVDERHEDLVITNIRF